MVRKRQRVEPTDDWQEILPLCWWPEQVEYERIRQPVLFGSPVDERAEETGVPERTLKHRIRSFETQGMEGLFETEKARRRRLPPNVRRLIVDLKTEYPPFNLNEIGPPARAGSPASLPTTSSRSAASHADGPSAHRKPFRL